MSVGSDGYSSDYRVLETGRNVEGSLTCASTFALDSEIDLRRDKAFFRVKYAFAFPTMEAFESEVYGKPEPREVLVQFQGGDSAMKKKDCAVWGVLLLLTLSPLSIAYADWNVLPEEGRQYERPASDSLAVCKIGSTYYTNIGRAIENAVAGDTIEVLPGNKDRLSEAYTIRASSPTKTLTIAQGVKAEHSLRLGPSEHEGPRGRQRDARAWQPSEVLPILGDPRGRFDADQRGHDRDRRLDRRRRGRHPVRVHRGELRRA